MLIRIILFRLLYLKNILFMQGVKFNGFTVIFSFKNSRIEIGNGSIINSSPVSNMLGLYQRTIIVARYGGKISIGEKCGISGSTIYAMSNISIGNNCQIGANCKIIDNDFHPLEKEIRRRSVDERYIRKKDVTIGNDCFIGMNSIVLKGTVLGDGVIVGAGSVVSGTFPDNVIIGGNPARVIR